jgi:hypothetical protein
MTHKLEYDYIEPLKNNRWIIKFNEEVKVSEYLFSSFSIKNEGEDFILKTKIYETVNYSFNPKDLFKITDVYIEYLDPTGVVVNGMKLPVKGSNLSKKCDYGKDGIMTTNFRFIIDSEKINMYYKNNDDK